MYFKGHITLKTGLVNQRASFSY